MQVNDIEKYYMQMKSATSYAAVILSVIYKNTTSYIHKSMKRPKSSPFLFLVILHRNSSVHQFLFPELLTVASSIGTRTNLF